VNLEFLGLFGNLIRDATQVVRFLSKAPAVKAW
jgi:hypothetical protein